MYMNKLESIPPDIGQLKGLTALGLNENNLKKLPPEIGNLTRLRILVPLPPPQRALVLVDPLCRLTDGDGGVVLGPAVQQTADCSGQHQAPHAAF
jgi:hypothetical protein